MTDAPASARSVLPESIAYAFAPGNGLARLDPAALPGTPSTSGFRWVQVRRDATEADRVLAACHLDPLVVEALRAEETRPRCSVHGDGAVVILRGVNLNPGAEPEDMISLRLWVEDRQVVGVWLRPLTAVADVLGSVERGTGFASPGELVAKLALRLADRAEPVIAGLNEAIDRLEESVLDAAPAALRGELARIRRSAIVLRRYMFPQRDALTTLEIEDFAWLSPTDRTMLREAANRVTRLGEELDAIRERAAIVYDEVMTHQADAMNRRMLVLSIVAAVFLPLGLLSGLLGMNVGGVPGVDWPYAFALVTTLCLLVGAGLYVLMKRLDPF